MSKKSDFAGVMSASLLLAGTSTLLINTIEEATLKNLNDLNKYYVSDSVTFTKSPELENMSFEQKTNNNKSNKVNVSININKNKKNKSSNDKSKKSNMDNHKIFKDFSVNTIDKSLSL